MWTARPFRLRRHEVRRLRPQRLLGCHRQLAPPTRNAVLADPNSPPPAAGASAATPRAPVRPCAVPAPSVPEQRRARLLGECLAAQWAGQHRRKPGLLASYPICKARARKRKVFALGGTIHPGMTGAQVRRLLGSAGPRSPSCRSSPPVTTGKFGRYQRPDAGCVRRRRRACCKGEPGHQIIWVNGVRWPTLTVYLPPKEKATGAAVVICPGGGYGGEAMDLEGYDVARRFVVLRRGGDRAEVPAADAADGPGGDAVAHSGRSAGHSSGARPCRGVGH